MIPPYSDAVAKPHQGPYAKKLTVYTKIFIVLRKTGVAHALRNGGSLQGDVAESDG